MQVLYTVLLRASQLACPSYKLSSLAGLWRYYINFHWFETLLLGLLCNPLYFWARRAGVLAYLLGSGPANTWNFCNPSTLHREPQLHPLQPFTLRRMALECTLINSFLIHIFLKIAISHRAFLTPDSEFAPIFESLYLFSKILVSVMIMTTFLKVSEWNFTYSVTV